MSLLKKLKGFRLQMRTEYPFGWSIVMGSFFIFLVILFGTSGYMMLEGWSFIESVYMVIITLSTVGFMEVRPLSDIARIMTMLVIFGGVGAFFLSGWLSGPDACGGEISEHSREAQGAENYR